MSLPGLLIEYLITGTTAFLWLWILIHHPWIVVPAELKPNTIDSATLGFVAPLAYVLGMIVDFASILLTEALEFLLLKRTLLLRRRIARALPERLPFRTNLNKWIQPRKQKEAPLSQQEVLLGSTELGKQLEMRSSRDRVARGAFLNVLIGTAVVSSYYAAHPQLQVHSRPILLGGLGLASLLFAMWYRFDRLTHKYRRKAGHAIRANRRAATCTHNQALQLPGAVSSSGEREVGASAPAAER